MSDEGPDHDKVFVVGVFVNGLQKGEGNGPSKQAAQVAAAAIALKSYEAES
jgi:dsRNA-specific ribonuclease